MQRTWYNEVHIERVFLHLSAPVGVGVTASDGRSIHNLQKLVCCSQPVANRYPTTPLATVVPAEHWGRELADFKRLLLLLLMQ